MRPTRYEGAIMTSTDLAQGRAEALNKTITEIMDFLGDDEKRPGGFRAKLRPYLHEKLGDLAEHWYRRGVRRGRIESFKEWKKTGKLSKKFRFERTRKFFEGQERRTRLTARIKP